MFLLIDFEYYVGFPYLVFLKHKQFQLKIGGLVVTHNALVRKNIKSFFGFETFFSRLSKGLVYRNPYFMVTFFDQAIKKVFYVKFNLMFIFFNKFLFFYNSILCFVWKRVLFQFIYKLRIWDIYIFLFCNFKQFNFNQRLSLGFKKFLIYFFNSFNFSWSFKLPNWQLWYLTALVALLEGFFTLSAIFFNVLSLSFVSLLVFAFKLSYYWRYFWFQWVHFRFNFFSWNYYFFYQFFFFFFFFELFNFLVCRSIYFFSFLNSFFFYCLDRYSGFYYDYFFRLFKRLNLRFGRQSSLIWYISPFLFDIQVVGLPICLRYNGYLTFRWLSGSYSLMNHYDLFGLFFWDFAFYSANLYSDWRTVFLNIFYYQSFFNNYCSHFKFKTLGNLLLSYKNTYFSGLLNSVHRIKFNYFLLSSMFFTGLTQGICSPLNFYMTKQTYFLPAYFRFFPIVEY